METFLSFLDNNWPLIIALSTAAAGVAWGLFKRFAAASENQIDDAIVRIIENNPLVVDKIARKVEELVADKLFAPDVSDADGYVTGGAVEIAVETDPQPSGTR